MRTRVTVILLGIFLLSLQAISGPPDWFLDSDLRDYPKEWYLIGTGSGESYEKALFRAQFELSSQIETKIEGEFSSLVESYSIDDRETIKSEYKTVGKTIVQATLLGAEIVEKSQSQGIYYVMLALDKDMYAISLMEEMKQKTENLLKVNEDSGVLIEKGKIIQALELLLNTDEITREIIATSVIYTSISGEKYNTDHLVYGPALLSKVRRMLGNIEIKKISGDGQSAINGKLLSEPVKVQIVYSDNNKQLPIDNLRIKLLDESGKTLQKQYTDSEGYAEFWEYANSTENGVYYVALDIRNISRVLKRDLDNHKAVFKYSINETEPVKFALEVTDEYGERLKEVEDNIAFSIIKSGHYVSDDAPFKLSGKMVVLEVNEINGLDGTQYLAKTEITLFMTFIQSNEDIASMTLNAKGLDKKSEANAIKKSFKKLKISSNKMSQMLAEAGDKLMLANIELSKEAFDAALVYYNTNQYQEALVELAKVNAGSTNLNNSALLIEEIKKAIILKNEVKLEEELNEILSESKKAEIVKQVSGSYICENGTDNLIIDLDGKWSITDQIASGHWEIISQDKLNFTDMLGMEKTAYLLSEVNKIIFDEKTYTKSE